MKIDSQRDPQTTKKQSINLHELIVSVTMISAIATAASTAIVCIALTVSFQSPSFLNIWTNIALILVEHLGHIGFKI